MDLRILQVTELMLSPLLQIDIDDDGVEDADNDDNKSTYDDGTTNKRVKITKFHTGDADRNDVTAQRDMSGGRSQNLNKGKRVKVDGVQGLKGTATQEAMSAEVANASGNKKRNKSDGESKGELNHASKAPRT